MREENTHYMLQMKIEANVLIFQSAKDNLHLKDPLHACLYSCCRFLGLRNTLKLRSSNTFQRTQII